jgi:hypothetical protein
METAPNVNQIIDVMRTKNYKVFKNTKGHDLNIVGIRTSSIDANTFNDWITVFYTFDKRWNFFAFPATTDPGTYWRKKLMNVKGTAVMKPGQYRKAYRIGKHNDQYKALRQQGNVTVYRDANRDNKLDTEGMPEDSGIFGINIHRAGEHTASTLVNKWSAGCQVFQDPDHFLFFLTLCERGRDKFSNSFTYTLLKEEDF